MDGTIVRIEASSGKLQAKVPTGVARVPTGVTSSADSVWALTDDKTTLTRIDPDTNQVVAELRLPAGCNTIHFSGGFLWATCPSEDLVLRIDPVRVVVDRRIKVPGGPWAIAFGGGDIWVLCRKAGNLDRVDPKTGEVTKTIDLAIPDSTGSIAVAQGSVWVSSPGFPVTRVELQTDKVAQQFFGDGGGGIQIGFNSIWLLNTRQKTISRIDPKRVLATLID
jgi:streptogramin lyase